MRSTKWWRWFLGLILLTALCIGGTELAVCRFADPVLYQQITSPIRRKAADLRDETAALAAAAWDTLSYAREQMTEALRRGEDVSLEDQAADSPVEAEVPPAADPAITSLKDRGGQEILTGGSREIIYYNQSDPEWSDQPYGSDTLGKYGCGPVSMAMAVSSLTEQTADPAEIAQWAVDNGHWARHGGSYLSIVSGVAENYGLSVESVPDCDADDTGAVLRQNRRRSDDQGAFYQWRTLHSPAGLHSRRQHPGGGPQQPRAELVPVGCPTDFGRAVRQPLQRRAAVVPFA